MDDDLDEKFQTRIEHIYDRFWTVGVTYNEYQWSALTVRSLKDLERLEQTIHNYLQEQKEK